MIQLVSQKVSLSSFHSFVVLPLTCMLKGRIAKLSAQFKEREPYPVRVDTLVTFS